jgi:hypothetical protein
MMLAAEVAASTSARMILPFGPVPLIRLRSTPFCDAIRRASGLAKIRSPPCALWAVGADTAGTTGAGTTGAGVGVATGAGEATGVGVGEAVGGGGGGWG